MKGFVQLSNESVPKSLWCRVGKDFKSLNQDLFVNEEIIRVRSTETSQLSLLVKIIKEFGERGYFPEEHYVVEPEVEAYP